MQHLVSKNVKLVKFTDRFVTPVYMDWLNDQEVNRYLCVGRFPISKEEIVNKNNSNNIMFAILTNLNKSNPSDSILENDFLYYVGTISLNGIDWINRKGEIGYMIGSKPHWGCGLVTQAVQLISDYALYRLNLNKVEAGVIDGNVGSIKALEKNGFKQYATIPCDHWLNGKYLDVHRFYKLQTITT